MTSTFLGDEITDASVFASEDKDKMSVYLRKHRIPVGDYLCQVNS